MGSNRDLKNHQEDLLVNQAVLDPYNRQEVLKNSLGWRALTGCHRVQTQDLHSKLDPCSDSEFILYMDFHQFHYHF